MDTGEEAVVEEVGEEAAAQETADVESGQDDEDRDDLDTQEMNGLSERGLLSCMALATNSLPTPVSPRISTVASVAATCCTRVRTYCSALLVPIISENKWASRISDLR